MKKLLFLSIFYGLSISAISQISFKGGLGVYNGLAFNFGVEMQIKNVVFLEEITPTLSANDISLLYPTFFQSKIGYEIIPHFTIFTGYSYGLVSNDFKVLNKGFISYVGQYANAKFYFKIERAVSTRFGEGILFTIGKKIRIQKLHYYNNSLVHQRKNSIKRSF